MDSIVPVGVATCCPAAASVAAVNVYVTVPFAFVVGVTLLQPEEKETRCGLHVEPRRATVDTGSCSPA